MGDSGGATGPEPEMGYGPLKIFCGIGSYTHFCRRLQEHMPSGWQAREADSELRAAISSLPPLPPLVRQMEECDLKLPLMAYGFFRDRLDTYGRETGRRLPDVELPPCTYGDITEDDRRAFELAVGFTGCAINTQMNLEYGHDFPIETAPALTVPAFLGSALSASLDGTFRRYPLLRKLALETLETLRDCYPLFPHTN